MIWDILSVIVTILQFITLFVVLFAFFIFVPFTALYLMSEGFRDAFLDYENWLDRKLIKRRWKKYTEEYGSFTALVGYSEQDVSLTSFLYTNLKEKHDTVYDEVAADHLLDPLGLKQAAKDFNTITTATEFNNADRPTD